MLKWYRNRIMLNETLEQNKNELQKYKNDKIVALLKDESNLIKDHLELLDENEKLKNAIDIIKNYYKFKLFPPAMDNIPEISISTDWEHYISQQEYELLKEVLGE